MTVADGSTTLSAVAGKGYFLDTNAGVIEVFLPSSPSRGDTFVFADYAGHFDLNHIIINTGGKNIDSTATGDVKVTTKNAIVELVYVDANKGWLVKMNQTAGATPDSVMNAGGGYDTSTHITATGGTVTTSGDFKIHAFTGDGTFAVTFAGQGTCASPSVVDYLVVAGGGSANGPYAGGGGAGGFRVSNSTGMPSPLTSPLASPTGITVTATNFPVTVGGGGSALTTAGFGVKGSDSVFSTITSTGGGRAGYYAGHGLTNPIGGPGGSGAGGAHPSNFAGGSGNTPPVSPPQGNDGGNGSPANNAQGGGGGAGAAGTNGGPPNTTPGVGGVGSYVIETGFAGTHGTPGPVSNAKYFAGGGGGGSDASASPGVGGAGGGGNANVPTGRSAGTANTGGGGGGGPNTDGQAGGKGIVLIRYKYQ